MAEYKPLSQQPPADNMDGSRLSTHMDSIRSTLSGSNSRSESQSEQGNAETRASDNEWTSPADFIESCFRPSIDLSTLRASGWLDWGSYASSDSQLTSIQHEHGRMESADTLLFSKPFLTRITGLTASRPSEAGSFGRKMWNPIWLTDAVLVSFVVLFIGLFFVALALYLYSAAHSGLL